MAQKSVGCALCSSTPKPKPSLRFEICKLPELTYFDHLVPVLDDPGEQGLVERGPRTLTDAWQALGPEEVVRCVVHHLQVITIGAISDNM